MRGAIIYLLAENFLFMSHFVERAVAAKAEAMKVIIAAREGQAAKRVRAAGGGGFDDDDEEVAEVCFYTNSNFRGRSFCAEPGDASGRLNSTFNDAISSIEVIGDAEVEVCTDRNLRGTCTTIRRDTGRLNSRVNDRISSFEIY